MGAYTAQILVGQSHTYDGGMINVSHTLFLSENDTPAWVIVPVNISGRKVNKQQEERKIWIPTRENMLEDALLMIGIYIFNDENLVQMANEFIQKPADRIAIELYNDISPGQLQLMYERSRQIDTGKKLMISVYEGSTIRNQLSTLENYKIDVEVCLSVYKREFSMWSKSKETRGRLEIS
jgi:hypothetical protein